MKKFQVAGLALACVSFALPAAAQKAAVSGPEDRGPASALPDIVRGLIDAAYRTEDAAQVAAVANAAKEVFPDYADAIDAYADEKRAALSPLIFDERESDEVIVVAEPAEPKVPPAAEARAEQVDLPPGKAPKFLGLGAWKGKATASGLIASGNSSNAAAGLLFEAHREAGPLTHNIGAYFDYGKSKGVKNQQRWGASYKLDVSLGDRTYGYGRVSYDEDEFSGFDYKLFAGLGIGHFLHDTERFKLKLEGGPGYQYAPIDDTTAIDEQFAFYGSGQSDWIIRDGLKLEQNFDAVWTSPTSTLMSNTALTTALTDTLSAGLSFLYRYETRPPAGRVSEDRTFRANLTYGF